MNDTNSADNSAQYVDSGVAPVEPRSKLTQVIQDHGRLIDVVLSVLIFAYDSMFLTNMFVWRDFSIVVFVASLALSASICLMYVLRRRSPLRWFAGVLILASTQLLLGVGFSPAPVVILALMLYALGSTTGWKVILPAVALSTTWVGVASVPVVEDERARVGEIGMLMLSYVVAALLGVVARNRRARFDTLRERAARLARERDAQAVIAAAEERARIAREIHDIVSHSLGTMVVMADGAAQTSEVDPVQAGHAMGRVRDTGRQAMTEMRRMLDVLRDEDPAIRSPQPGLGQLDQLVDATRAAGLRVDLTVAGVPVKLPSGIDLAAYRIVQEALTNARKHGGPLLSIVRVAVAYFDDRIEVRVTDDGRDSSLSGKMPGTGHGLVGMRERVAAYGGSLQARPCPAGGFEVHAVLPLEGVK